MNKLMVLAACVFLAACSDGDSPSLVDTKTVAGPNGQTVSVRLDEIIDPATDTAELGAGNRYVAVVFTVLNTSDAPFTETRPDSDAVMITSASADVLTADLHEVSDCEPFAKDVTEVAPGDELSGCVTFEVPADADLVRFQYYFSDVVTFEL
jgi:hypothetical protein